MLMCTYKNCASLSSLLPQPPLSLCLTITIIILSSLSLNFNHCIEIHVVSWDGMHVCWEWRGKFPVYRSLKMLGNQLAHVHTTYRIAGNFRGRKLSRISRFESHPRKFSPRNLGAYRTHLWLVSSNPWKFSLRNSHFLQIRGSFLPRKFTAIR